MSRTARLARPGGNEFGGLGGMIADAFLWILNRTPSLRRALWRVFFDLLASPFGNIGWWTLMDYGYPEAGSASPPFHPDTHGAAQRDPTPLLPHNPPRAAPA